MSVIITLKNIDNPEKLGGIGIYYKVLQSHFTNGIKYFNYSDDDSKNILVKSFYRFYDIIKFAMNCFSRYNSHDLIHLNPSLSWSSIIRDGILLLVSKLSGKKTVIFIRGWHEYMVNKIENKKNINSLFKWVYNKSDAFIVLSNDFKEKLREWGFKQKIFVETTVVDNTLLNGNLANIKINKNNDSLYLLFLARVEKAKGIFEVIDIYEYLKHKYPNIHLIIAGDGGSLQEIKSIVENRNIQDFEFTGYVTGEAKARTFAKSDVYIFPSYGEGMPNSVLEAMAFGLPVITRPVGGLRDFFEDGKMGFLTESKDPKVFAQLTEKLILDPDLCRQMGKYNAQFARKHFLASVVAKRLERIYEDVLNGEVVERSWMDTIEENPKS